MRTVTSQIRREFARRAKLALAHHCGELEEYARVVGCIFSIGANNSLIQGLLPSGV
jgi:hypothetical protein